MSSDPNTPKMLEGYAQSTSDQSSSSSSSGSVSKLALKKLWPLAATSSDHDNTLNHSAIKALQKKKYCSKWTWFKHKISWVKFSCIAWKFGILDSRKVYFSSLYDISLNAYFRILKVINFHPWNLPSDWPVGSKKYLFLANLTLPFYLARPSVFAEILSRKGISKQIHYCISLFFWFLHG